MEEECKHGYWEETLEDAYWVCEKGVYDCENCEQFEKIENSEVDLDSKKFFDVPKDYVRNCSSSSLQGCTIYFKDVKDLKCGDVFVLKSMSRSANCGVYGVELQKIYPYKIGG